MNTNILKALAKSKENLFSSEAILKSTVICKSDDEQRLFYSVVIEPMTEVTKDGDAHGHVMNVEEIEKSAHEYMLTGPVVYRQHIKKTDAKVVESYLAPVDFTPEGSDEVITKGSWVMVTKIFDDALWGAIKKGEVTAYSPGGFGIITELE